MSSRLLNESIVKMKNVSSIRSMFDSLAGRYDRFNRLVSFGLDHFWRSRTLSVIRPGMRVLDVGTGTGELAIGAYKRLRGQGSVVGLDFSEPMLLQAQAKQQRLGIQGDLKWVLRKAEEIPFEEVSYDAVLSGFVLRNIALNIDSILKGIHQSLREGGLISFIDLTEPENALMRRLGFIYLNVIVYYWGRCLFKSAYPGNYLKESMQNFFRPKAFVKHLEEIGFKNIKAHSYLFGMITHYTAQK